MSRRLNKATDWLAEGARFRYSVGRIARARKISRQQLRRHFQEQFGENPQKWLDRQRVEAAMQLLASGESVKRVAADLGFSDSPHFVRFFEHETGQSPGQFQKMFPKGN